MELMRGRVQELDRDLADASAGRKEQVLLLEPLVSPTASSQPCCSNVLGRNETANERGVCPLASRMLAKLSWNSEHGVHVQCCTIPGILYCTVLYCTVLYTQNNTSTRFTVCVNVSR